MQNAFVILQILLSSMTTLKMLMTTLTTLKMLMTVLMTMRQCLHLYYLLSLLLVGPSPAHSSNDGCDLVLSSIAHMTQMDLTWFWDLTQLLELCLIWLPLQWPIRMQTMILASTNIHCRRK